LLREKVTGSWRKLYNEELQNFYASPNIIRVIKVDEMGGKCSTDGRYEKFIRYLVGKFEGKRPL